jgi:succinate dehydrogenase / fumarate reductase cytochrome b subunit
MSDAPYTEAPTDEAVLNEPFNSAPAPSVYTNLPVPHALPRAFLFRRLHSIAGLFFVLFLIEHMLTNSEAALWVGEEGSGFVRAVNFFQTLPYLNLIELFLLAVPISIHAFLGVRYFCEARWNSWVSNGSRPALKYTRNHAFTWQRLTAVVLVLGVAAHVLSMRFLERPQEVDIGPHSRYAVPVVADAGLLTLAPRLKSIIVTPDTIAKLQSNARQLLVAVKTQSTIANPDERLFHVKNIEHFAAVLNELRPTDEAWTVITPDFGTAFLLIVRENFRSPWICILYTIFVMAACFHAANGLWTWSISWGIPLNEQGRRVVRAVGVLLGLALLAGGLASIWMTYWVTLHN